MSDTEGTEKDVMVSLSNGKFIVITVSSSGGLDIESGHLVCRDKKGWVEASFAPGSWLCVHPLPTQE